MPNARATAFLINALMVMPAFVLQISHIFVLLILYNCSLKKIQYVTHQIPLYDITWMGLVHDVRVPESVPLILGVVCPHCNLYIINETDNDD